jgi:putative transposase
MTGVALLDRSHETASTTESCDESWLSATSVAQILAASRIGWAKGRLLSILLTGGQAHDCPPAQRLIRRTKAASKLLGDRAYDSAELRQWLSDRGTKPVVPNKSNRKQPFTFDRKSYKQRHRIENAFCRLKDFRRIATRYDRLARNFLASVCLVAAIVWWTL